MPHYLNRKQQLERREMIVQLVRDGRTIEEVRQLLGYKTVQAVYNVLARMRKQGVDI